MPEERGEGVQMRAQANSTQRQVAEPDVSARSRATRQPRPVRVLFVSDSPTELERYFRELGDHYFAMSSHVAHNAQEFAERVSSQPYDIVISDDTARDWTGLHALELLRERDQDMPFIMVAAPADDETVAEFILNGASDCIDRNRLSLLPLAVALAVEERAARDDRNRMEQELQRSRSLYNALVENPTFGVCQVNANGLFVHANETLVAMLGYASLEELRRTNLMTDVMREPERTKVQEALFQTDRIEGIYVDWVRKDGTLLRVHLSGRQIRDETKALDDEWELIAQDLTAQRALEDNLRHLAATDPLTGLANHRKLAEALDAEMRRAQRTERGFAVVMLDLDGLKQINDKYGHLTGDRALRRVADALLTSCRSLDTVARYGGDEFALVLPETGPEGAAVIKRRIRQCLTLHPEEPQLSASVGVALYPRDGETIERLLLAADRALYRRKRRQTSSVPAQGRIAESVH